MAGRMASACGCRGMGMRKSRVAGRQRRIPPLDHPAPHPYKPSP
jgi:hypothetical protein